MEASALPSGKVWQVNDKIKMILRSIDSIGLWDVYLITNVFMQIYSQMYEYFVQISTLEILSYGKELTRQELSRYLP